jgi:hypothetical protein
MGNPRGSAAGVLRPIRVSFGQKIDFQGKKVKFPAGPNPSTGGQGTPPDPFGGGKAWILTGDDPSSQAKYHQSGKSCQSAQVEVPRHKKACPIQWHHRRAGQSAPLHKSQGTVTDRPPAGGPPSWARSQLAPHAQVKGKHGT